MMAYSAITPFSFEKIFTFNNILCMCVSSFFIGSIYPLTQIYQHDADKKDGVISISYKLGYTGTFLFSAMFFITATIFLFFYFNLKHQQMAVLLFLLLMLPAATKLSVWFKQVRKDIGHANFENTMIMNLLTSSCMNIYFLLLILNNYYTWF